MDIKNSILADAINTLTELGKKAAEPKELTVNGRSFLVTGSNYEEIEQPESEFVFRIYDDRSISLTAADGGMWKMYARSNVRAYLLNALREEINAGQVVVAL